MSKISKLPISKLPISKLLISKLLTSKLLISKLLISKLLISTSWFLPEAPKLISHTFLSTLPTADLPEDLLENGCHRKYVCFKENPTSPWPIVRQQQVFT
jgi:hypothetical protein